MKIVNGWRPLTIFAKHSILDVRQGSEYILVTFTEEILNGKLYFLCSACIVEKFKLEFLTRRKINKI